MKNTHNTSQHHLSDELLKPNPIIEQIHQSYTFLDELSKPSLMIEQIQQSTQLYEPILSTQDIIKQINQSYSFLDELPKPNLMIEQIQHSLSNFEPIFSTQDMIKQINQSYALLDELFKSNPIIEQIQQSTQLYEQLYKTDIISSFTSKLKDIEYNDDNLVNQVEETKPMVDVFKSLPKEFQETLIEKVKLYIDEQVDIKVSKKLKETTSEINSSSTTTPKVTTIFNDAIATIATALESLYGFYTICPDSMKNDVYLICFLLLMTLFAIPTIYFLYNYYK